MSHTPRTSLTVSSALSSSSLPNLPEISSKSRENSRAAQLSGRSMLSSGGATAPDRAQSVPVSVVHLDLTRTAVGEAMDRARNIALRQLQQFEQRAGLAPFTDREASAFQRLVTTLVSIEGERRRRAEDLDLTGLSEAQLSSLEETARSTLAVAGGASSVPPPPPVPPGVSEAVSPQAVEKWVPGGEVPPHSRQP